MKLYRVGLRDDFDEHQGYEYFSSLRDAKKCVKECNATSPLCSTPIEVEEITFHLSRHGIIDLLANWASHPDNG